MKEQLEQYVNQVKQWHEHCRGNEQATKASLIAPLFVLLGYNMHDPRECKPEYRPDFGKGEKAATPVDWAFFIDGRIAFFVEAKEAGANILKYPEQLGMYFSKQPGANGVKLGILTSGIHWHFFTDLRYENAMDTEPFFTWDVLNDDPALVMQLLTVLHRSKLTPTHIKTFAATKHHTTLLVRILDRLLKPSPEFVKFALSTAVNDSGDTIVSAPIKAKVIEQWEPILADAIHEWAKRQALTIVLQNPNTGRETTSAAQSEQRQKKSQGGASLADLIGAGIVTPPLRLFRNYKGQVVEATVRQDGQVVFQGTAYPSSSEAGAVARAFVTGQRKNTNGWTFWQYEDQNGKHHRLDDARQRLSKTKGGGAEHPERNALRKKFWSALLARPRIKGTRHEGISPSEFHWIGARVRGLQLNYVIGQDEGRAELYIDGGSKEENKSMFKRLRGHKDEIERAFGGELSWQPLPDKRACRIAYTVAGGGWKSEESKWPAVQDGMIDAMARLERAIAPELEALKRNLG